MSTLLPRITFEECEILPQDIDLSKDLGNTFGKHETEQSAVIVLKFFQSKGNWEPFTRDEFTLWYYQSGYTKPYNFHALIKEEWNAGYYGGYLLLDDGEVIFPTKNLIERCFERHPVQRIPME